MKRNATTLLILVAIIVVAINIILNSIILLQPGDYILGQQVGQTGIARVTVLEKVSLTLPVNAVDFGSKQGGDADNTLDNTPGPFILENSGNVNLDIVVKAGDSLWDTQPATSSSFQFQSAEDEAGSLDTGGSLVTVFTNIPIDPAAAVAFATRLKYQAAADQLQGEISVQVPVDEGPGLKDSTLTFTASKAV